MAGYSDQRGRGRDRNPALTGSTDVLKKSFPNQANGTSPIVLHAYKGQLTDSGNASAVNAAAGDVGKAPNVASVVNPLTPQAASALSQDKTTGYLSVTLAYSTAIRPSSSSGWAWPWP